MDGDPDSEKAGGGESTRPLPSTLPDYEDEPDPDMENTARDEQENVMAFEDEFGMEVEPDPEEHIKSKERSYSIRSNQSDSSVSEKAKKFIAENRPGPSKMLNIEKNSADHFRTGNSIAAIPPPPPAQTKRDFGENSSKNEGGGGCFCAFFKRE
jgi:hypothetical protein